MESFEEHSRIRRLHLSTCWTIEDVVYGRLGPIITTSTHRHQFDHHFSQLNASYPDALEDAVNAMKPHWKALHSISFVDFEHLFDSVSKILSPVKGIGLLAIYDISLRLGCSLCPKIIPEKYVYVHGNIVERAVKILLPTVKITNHMVDVKLFSSVIPHYSAMEIEDILCHYNDVICKKAFFDINWLKDTNTHVLL